VKDEDDIKGIGVGGIRGSCAVVSKGVDLSSQPAAAIMDYAGLI